ncbi:Tgt2/MlaC family protein [Archangium lansingense]|uniref:ABC transporter substrate-binding protein n=1 Tax=Archangium lansingense TaxID=2995310 RepID=A0ABT4AME9_9BACT|nr:ABC transporter substrate-binding protein [Archangium lansinium]MCY1082029.1 ABC transporter substrate-binding protein [Archangium lansinium]
MNARLRSLSLLATLTLALPVLAAPNEPVAKPVKTVVQSVRYSKDDLALKQLANDEQGRFLLGEDWEKGTEAQRKEFTKLFNSLFAKIAFPKVRENFKNLASITYEDPAVEGEKANVKSTVVIEHPLKKQEMKLQYSVVKSQGGWKVLDVAVLGDSMLTGIRDDQVRPIMKQGGWDHLLQLMRAKEAELTKK